MIHILFLIDDECFGIRLICLNRLLIHRMNFTDRLFSENRKIHVYTCNFRLKTHSIYWEMLFKNSIKNEIMIDSSKLHSMTQSNDSVNNLKFVFLSQERKIDQIYSLIFLVFFYSSSDAKKNEIIPLENLPLNFWINIFNSKTQNQNSNFLLKYQVRFETKNRNKSSTFIRTSHQKSMNEWLKSHLSYAQI